AVRGVVAPGHEGPTDVEHVDHHPLAPLDHPPGHRPGQQEGGPGIEPPFGVERGRVGLQEGSPREARSAVDQHLDGSECALDVGNERRELGVITEIGPEGLGPPARTAGLGDERLRRLGGSVMVDGHDRAIPGERLDDGPTHPDGPPGHQRHASVEPHLRGLLAAAAGSVMRAPSPMPTFRPLLEQARALVPEVAPEALAARLRAGDAPVLIDVREPDESAEGHLPGALLVPRGTLELGIERMVGREREIVVYWASGVRSILAARTLLDLGYGRVSSLAGGFGRWSDLGLPRTQPAQLRAEQKARYRRHLSLPEVGEAGQARLASARVLVLG